MRTKCNKRKIKGQKGVRPNWSLILERTKRRVKKRGEVKKKRRRSIRREERYGTCMETMILVWIIRLLDFCMDFYGLIWILVCSTSRV